MPIRSGWSTRELAEIAGTTLKAVRHYHRIGLLPEPERAPNGYKQYRITHLIRLLRIRRLVDLGVALPDIRKMEESDEGAEQMFRTLDAELAASIERQQRMRDDLAAILQHRDLAELPPGFGEVAGDLSEADRGFALLGARIFDPWVMDTMRKLLAAPRTEAGREFEALTEEAGEETRQDLAVRFAPEVRRSRQDHPRLTEWAEHGAADGDPRAWSTFLLGVAELYNPAQIDVLQRIDTIIGRGTFPHDGRGA
jgi:DNA-binding transcriptional MerR regulator